MFRAKRNGFTIVEGALAAALLTLVVPVAMLGLVGARRNARKTVCKTNLKGFINGFVIYYDAFGQYPSLGNKDKELAATPTRRFAKLGDMASNADSRHCNIQPLYLLYTYCGMDLDQFGCPSDAQFKSVGDIKDFDPDEYGFVGWHNVSYAFPPTSTAYKCNLGREIRDTSIYMMGDRPQAGSLESGSANHKDGSNFLQYNGAVTWQTSNTHPIEGPGKNVYLLDMPEAQQASKEIFLHYHKDNTKEKPQAPAESK